jgi:hypothetical protein
MSEYIVILTNGTQIQTPAEIAKILSRKLSAGGAVAQWQSFEDPQGEVLSILNLQTVAAIVKSDQIQP